MRQRHNDTTPAQPFVRLGESQNSAHPNLTDWRRLPDLKADNQQQNVVLPLKFANGKYAFYTLSKLKFQFHCFVVVNNIFFNNRHVSRFQRSKNLNLELSIL